MIYVTSSWSQHGAAQAIFCHPDSLNIFMEQRWPEVIAEAAGEVARSLWLQMGRRERDRCSLEVARASARRKEWRTR
jgi:hypothetical protein